MRPLFVCWIDHNARSVALARDLDADIVFLSAGRTGNRWSAPLRQLLLVPRTIALVWRRQPAALVVMAPPAVLFGLAIAVARLRGIPVVVDAHTSAVIRRADGRPNPTLRWFGPRASLVIIHNADLQDLADQAGVRSVVMDDPPFEPAARPPIGRPEGRFRFVYPCSWSVDEPIAELVSAAQAVPEADFVLTGTPRDAMLGGPVPGNVELTGRVPDDDFAGLLAGADAILALTTRDATMQRAGYEALAYGKPCVASDTGALRRFFGDAAIYAGRGAGALATACRTLMVDHDHIAGQLDEVRTRHREAYEAALDEIRHALGAGAA